MKKTFTVEEVGSQIQRSPGTNSPYVECKTNIGCVAFWGSDEKTKNQKNNMKNITFIRSKKESAPFTVTLTCNAPIPIGSERKKKWKNHDWWVYESFDIQ